MVESPRQPRGTAHAKECGMDQDQVTALAPEGPLVEPVYTTGEVSQMLKVPLRTVQE